MFKGKNSYCLVLAGGGAKGVYQIGAWQALKELNITFNAIIGTSIGSINAALIAQGDYEVASNIWKNLSLDKVIKVPQELLSEGSIDINFSNLFHLSEVFGDFFAKGGIDTTPLKSMIDEYLDEDKIRKTGIDLGIVSYNIKKFLPLEIFIDEIAEGTLGDYLLASSSLPGFKVTKIGDNQFIDGGLYNNIPYSLARDRGYKKIIVLDVSGLGNNRDPIIIGSDTVYIKNSIDFGNILDFSQEFLTRFRLLGYLDTLRVFEKIDGIHYFYHYDDHLIQKLHKRLYSKEFLSKGLFAVTFQKPLETQIREVLPKEYKKHKDIIKVMMECAAESLNIEKIELYSVKDLIGIIKNRYEDIKEFSNQGKALNLEPIIHLILNKNTQELTSNLEYSLFLYYYMLVQLTKGINSSTYELAKNILAGLFPILKPAEIFFTILEMD